jgi:type VI secretion system secreted protein VgrG
MAVRLMLDDDGKRFFHGYVSSFSQTGMVGNFFQYQAVLRPWLWFLTRTADCRIFQNMTVPDILKKVFRDHGFTDFDESLSGSYRTWEYCVQYRETDFNFVSRLMEQEGIYYYYKHEESKHTLVLADSYSSHSAVSGYDDVPYFPPTSKNIRERDHIHDWTIWKNVQPGVYALTDFDFERPKASLATKATVARNHASDDLEIYDYPGEYIDTADGDTYSRARIEELHSQYETVVGTGNARGLTAGGLFKLSDFPREDQNREYLIVSATHRMRSDEFEPTGARKSESVYTGTLTAIDAQQQYRPPRITPKPLVQGPQTAIVVGKPGEEIWTDKYGRVKVQFHWDREGESDENSSCWVRVAQVWAGKTWGGIHIPRIGQEVIVEFLEGDPDHPIITGRVYNADEMPPYTLPDNQTQSGIKSRSSKGGSGENFNEIRFEDLKGEEQVFIHAEKNQDVEVENDETHWVGHDRTKKVDNDETTTIGNDKTVDVVNNHKETVGGTQTVTVKKSRTDSVTEDEERTVSGNRTRSVGKDETISIAATQKISVDKNRSVAVSKDDGLSVGGNLATSVSKNAETTVTNNYSLDAKKIVIDGGNEISIKTGSASIVMKKNGDITIKGKKINIKGSGDVIIKGSKISEN